MEGKVLVLGGNEYKMASVIRNLSQNNLEVHIVVPNKKSSMFWSRYPKKRFIIKDNLVREIEKLNEREKYDLIFIPNEGLEFFKNKKKIFDNIILSEEKSIKIAADKEKTMKLAKSLGVKIPKTIYVKNIKELERISNELKYPVIIKPSHIEEDGYKPEYVFNKNVFVEKYKNYHLKSKYPIIQEIINGPGAGVFVLCKEGKVLQFFGHKRLLEQDPYGAGSAVCESMIIPEQIKEDVRKICRKLKWNGVMMLEYKIDEKKNKFFLIEINARFWGSLALAIYAGIEFPILMYRLHRGEEIKEKEWIKLCSGYFTGKLKYLRRVFVGKKEDWEFHFPSKIKAFGNLFKIRGKKDFMWDKKDPLPFFVDIISSMKK